MTKSRTVKIIWHIIGMDLCSRSIRYLIHLARLWFRPKILVDVERVDFTTKILGQKSRLPVYIVSRCYRTTIDPLSRNVDSNGSRKTRSSGWRTEPHSRSGEARRHPDGQQVCFFSYNT